MNMQEVKDAILAAYMSVDRAIDEATRQGEAAHEAGATQTQHTLERTTYALMQARGSLIEAMIECNNKGETK